MRRRWLPIVIRLAALGCLIFAAATVALWTRHNRPVELPAPTGPYAVGRAQYDWVDPARLETLGGDPSRHRELEVWVWYPAAPRANAARSPYLPPRWRAARERDYGPLAILTQDLGAVGAHAADDAPLAPERSAYPVVILLPGLGPIAGDYTTIAEDLASHGYVVVGVTPTYSASLAVFRDGSVARGTAAGNVPDDASPQESRQILDRLIAIWSADASFALDRIEQLAQADPDGRFTGRLDLGRVGIVGHSFGGATAAQVCAADPRARAGIDLDGYPYGTVIATGVPRPFLFIWSEPQDTVDAGWQQASRDVATLVAASQGVVRQMTIGGTRHFNFADYAVLFAPVVKYRGGLGAIDGRRGLAITTAYVRAFLNQALLGADEPLLDGPADAYPEVRFGPPAGMPR